MDSIFLYFSLQATPLAARNRNANAAGTPRRQGGACGEAIERVPWVTTQGGKARRRADGGRAKGDRIFLRLGDGVWPMASCGSVAGTRSICAPRDPAGKISSRHTSPVDSPPPRNGTPNARTSGRARLDACAPTPRMLLLLQLPMPPTAPAAEHVCGPQLHERQREGAQRNSKEEDAT